MIDDVLSPTTEPIMDPAWLNRAQACVDPCQLHGALSLFVKELREYQQTLEKDGIAKSTLQTICLALKGSADSFGAQRLHHTATMVEKHLQCAQVRIGMTTLKTTLRQTRIYYQTASEGLLTHI